MTIKIDEALNKIQSFKRDMKEMEACESIYHLSTHTINIRLDEISNILNSKG